MDFFCCWLSFLECFIPWRAFDPTFSGVGCTFWNASSHEGPFIWIFLVLAVLFGMLHPMKGLWSDFIWCWLSFLECFIPWRAFETLGSIHPSHSIVFQKPGIGFNLCGHLSVLICDKKWEPEYVFRTTQDRQTDNVRIMWHWGVFRQQLLQWKSIKYYIFWVSF